MHSLSVILLSGGQGRRFGGLKQYQLLCGKPLVLHSLELFLTLPFVSEMIVVCEKEDEKIFGNAIFARPGKERQDSMKNGLEKATSDFVCIHDGARPLVKAADVERCYRAALENGAAALAVRPSDTIKKKKAGEITTLDRSLLWQMQTPQIIKRSLLVSALEAVDCKFTDDLSIVEAFGHTPIIVEGSRDNIKVTEPLDLKIAEILCSAIN